MRFWRVALLAILLAGFIVSGVSAVAPIMVFPNNSSAEQLGGAYNAYKFASGNDTFNVFTLVPLTVQDLVYPLEFWYACFWISFVFIILGILLSCFPNHMPSHGIIACGLLAMCGFAICAVMLPYTATMLIDTQVVQNVLPSGAPTGNNTVYITQIADYRASPPHAYICWGLATAGFIEMVFGTLTYFEWFQIWLLKRKARRQQMYTQHVETEGGYDNDEYKSKQGASAYDRR